MTQVKPRALAVLLCYNDADVLGHAIESLLENDHDIIAWDHGSTDETRDVLDNYKADGVRSCSNVLPPR